MACENPDCDCHNPEAFDRHCRSAYAAIAAATEAIGPAIPSSCIAVALGSVLRDWLKTAPVDVRMTATDQMLAAVRDEVRRSLQ